MNLLIQSQIFFFISSIGFILLWILIMIFLFYLIRIVKIFYRIANKAEKDINIIGDITKEIIKDLKKSLIFNIIFKKKEKKNKK